MLRRITLTRRRIHIWHPPLHESPIKGVEDEGQGGTNCPTSELPESERQFRELAKDDEDVLIMVKNCVRSMEIVKVRGTMKGWGPVTILTAERDPYSGSVNSTGEPSRFQGDPGQHSLRRSHGIIDGTDHRLSHGLQQMWPSDDDVLQVRIDWAVFCINCCAWRCAFREMCVFLGVYRVNKRTHNPLVEGSSPSGPIQ